MIERAWRRKRRPVGTALACESHYRDVPDMYLTSVTMSTAKCQNGYMGSCGDAGPRRKRGFAQRRRRREQAKAPRAQKQRHSQRHGGTEGSWKTPTLRPCANQPAEIR